MVADLMQDYQTSVEFFEKHFPKGSYSWNSNNGNYHIVDEKLLQDLKNKALAHPPLPVQALELKSVDLAQLEVDLHKFVTTQLEQAQDAKAELEQFQNFTKILIKIKSKKELTMGECREIHAYSEKVKASNINYQIKIQISQLINSLLKRHIPIPDFKREESILPLNPDKLKLPEIKESNEAKFAEGYTKTMENYLKTFRAEEGEKRQKTIAEKITELKLTEEESVLFDEFCDPITEEFINIPVSLNENYYDKKTLEDLKKDPSTGETLDPLTHESFERQQITPGRKLFGKLDEVIKKLNQNRAGKIAVEPRFFSNPPGGPAIHQEEAKFIAPHIK